MSVSRAEWKTLVVDNLDLADAIARRYTVEQQDSHDLRQVAYVGLVKAAQRFDRSRGGAFAAFAMPTIAGELKRHLRDNGWWVRPPRPVQDVHTQVSRIAPQLAQELGRHPTTTELARATGQSVETVEEALRCRDGLRPASLDATSPERDGATLAESLGVEDASFERADRIAALGAACRSLTQRERRILYLRFYEERTQQQIGAELGVTQMQVSRLLVQILERLRVKLGVPAPVVRAA